MTKKWLFSYVFLALISFDNQAQFFRPILPQVSNYDTSRVGYTQFISGMYPFFVSEITTYSKKQYRGQIFIEDDGYSIVTRNKRRFKIIQDEIDEVAWTIPDRRDFTFYSGIGLYGLSINSNSVDLAYGFLADYNWELPKNDLVISLPIQIGFDFHSVQNSEIFEIYDYVSIELMLGKRFNRESKHIHTISAGGGFGSNLLYSLYESDAFPFVLTAQYDFEVPVGTKTSLALFGKYQFYNRHPMNERMIFGLSLRFYRNRILQLTNVYPNALLFL